MMKKIIIFKELKINILISLLLIFIFATTHAFSQDVHIIPQPKEMKVNAGQYLITNATKIYTNMNSMKIAELLGEHFNNEFGLNLDIIVTTKKKKKGISFKYDKELKTEAYKLFITQNGVQIIASDVPGWFYGVQTILQLMTSDSLSKKNIKKIEIPLLTIKDEPRFKWRAFMLDESRYFKGKKVVKSLLDEMAFLKMNVFHWHLVDDPGWRIEIKKYPKLTEIGSKRKSTQVGSWGSPKQSAEPHEGYYTQEEIKEIIKYAQERNITIIPEIEMPGHCSAAIVAYPWLGATKKQLEMPTKFELGKDIYDVADPKVNQFLTDVLDEIMALFPSKVIHIGGDEVKYDTWKESKSINEYMKEKNLDSYADLQLYFTNSISQYLKKKNRRMMGWNEIMGKNVHKYQSDKTKNTTQNLAKETIIHFWYGDIKLVSEAAQKGFEIVNSSNKYTYLDFTYNNIPLSKAYNFEPIPKELEPKYHKYVIGLGCQMWCEWVPTVGHLHFQVFPRIAAFAEVGWTQSKNKNFENFKLGLKNLQKRWKMKGIYFAPDTHVEKKSK